MPDQELVGDGEGVLIIDDLVDTGKTLEVVRKVLPKAHVATVYAKPMGRDQVNSFVTEVSQDTWIFFPWDLALQYVEPTAARLTLCHHGAYNKPNRAADQSGA